MQIDENTPGSLANEEAVRVLKGWLFALYVVDALVCIMGALRESLSIPYGFWLLFKSLFFSYFVGIILLIVAIRFFGRRIGITKITPVGLLRYCVLFACISVIMGGVLVYRASPVTATVHPGTSLIH
jgi:small basic protein